MRGCSSPTRLHTPMTPLLSPLCLSFFTGFSSLRGQRDPPIFFNFFLSFSGHPEVSPKKHSFFQPVPTRPILCHCHHPLLHTHLSPSGSFSRDPLSVRSHSSLSQSIPTLCHHAIQHPHFAPAPALLLLLPFSRAWLLLTHPSSHSRDFPPFSPSPFLLCRVLIAARVPVPGTPTPPSACSRGHDGGVGGVCAHVSCVGRGKRW